MKQLFCIALLGAIFYSCGEEGIGFNARKEVGVESPMEVPSVPVNILDAPEQRQDISFNLEDVTSDLDFLDEIELNGISYEITGIDPNEELDIDELTVTISTSSGDIEFLSLTSLANTNGKIALSLSASELLQLENQIFSSTEKELNGEILLDLIDFPEEDLEFTITTYFDVTAKIRDL
ncbi:MAG: hypothetical protein RIC35_12150 [Marinoscillum sp.]